MKLYLFLVAQLLLERGSVSYNGNEMRITKLESKSVSESSNDENSESARTVEVIGIPKDVSKEFLYMFLENKRKSGGGTIEKMQFGSTPGKAIVTFEDERGKNFQQFYIYFQVLVLK